MFVCIDFRLQHFLPHHSICTYDCRLMVKRRNFLLSVLFYQDTVRIICERICHGMQDFWLDGVVAERNHNPASGVVSAVPDVQPAGRCPDVFFDHVHAQHRHVPVGDAFRVPVLRAVYKVRQGEPGRRTHRRVDFGRDRQPDRRPRRRGKTAGGHRWAAENQAPAGSGCGERSEPRVCRATCHVAEQPVRDGHVWHLLPSDERVCAENQQQVGRVHLLLDHSVHVSVLHDRHDCSRDDATGECCAEIRLFARRGSIKSKRGFLNLRSIFLLSHLM